jgi:transposase
MNRVRARINLTDDERVQLQAIRRRQTTAHSLVQRANIVLLAEEKQNNSAVADTLNVSAKMVLKWTHRWQDLKEERKSIVDRLSDAPRSGKPASITAESICQLVALACDDPYNYDRPISHWTCDELTDEAIKQNIFVTISSRHVGRILSRLELRPHKNQYWLHKKVDASRDEKISELCELYKEASALKKAGRSDC